MTRIRRSHYRTPTLPREINSSYSSSSSDETTSNQNPNPNSPKKSERSPSHLLPPQNQEMMYSTPKSTSNELEIQDQDIGDQSPKTKIDIKRWEIPTLDLVYSPPLSYHSSSESNDEDIRAPSPRISSPYEISETPPIDIEYSSPLSCHSDSEFNEFSENGDIKRDGGGNDVIMDEGEVDEESIHSIPSPPPVLGFLRDRPRSRNVWGVNVTQEATPPITEDGADVDVDVGEEYKGDGCGFFDSGYEDGNASEISDLIENYLGHEMQGEKQQFLRKLKMQRDEAIKNNPMVRYLLVQGKEEEVEEMMDAAEALIWMRRGLGYER